MTNDKCDMENGKWNSFLLFISFIPPIHPA
jgi:hypothetical protein